MAERDIRPGDLLLTIQGGLFVVEGEPKPDGSVSCCQYDIAGIPHPIDIPKNVIRSIFHGAQP